uniref:MYND-type domain-containing protein n=1 Tax=Bionectria ochroleuca TaxID=29856 RepID=A0A8H7TTE1_BIOOC
MGRWGYRLFEGDHDIDIAGDLGEILKGKPLKLSRMVFQTDMLAPQEARMFYQTDEYKPILEQNVAEVRAQLDSGLGDCFFEKVLAQAKQNTFDGPYRIIIAGALMMRAGAKIKPNHIQYLRGLAPKIHCNHRYALPLFDQGFREPGRVQFLNALDNYAAGAPRDFQEPSCFTCGRSEVDLGFSPKRCSRCRSAWYCSQKCQKAQWANHKPACIPPEKKFMLNV